MGKIHFSNNNVIISSEDLTESLLAAYLLDVNEIDFIAGGDYTLKQDYFVVKKDKYADYKHKYQKTSGLWGGFISKEAIPTPYTQTVISLQAIENLAFPTTWHEENTIRAIQQPYSFERFLKSYHLLELLFDWQILKEIRDLYENNDILNAGKILDKHEREDIKRLQYIIRKRYKSIPNIVDKLNQIIHFQAIAKDIFYTYGKESNPLKSEIEFEDILSKSQLFAKESFRTNQSIYRDYDTFILKLAAYWIYRIRSSIAHSKIGEYQFSYTQEEFMIKFAEPLLNEVLIQCFSI
jgi:hypothetical protein